MQKSTLKHKKNMRKQAFTLIELLIVIAIIGILFIVLVSKVDFATDKAKASGVQTDFRSFQVALETVSKENAGFNTFGWDTGDNASAAPSGYTYTNADKDKGDRIRNSYDEGDTNLNGTYDDGEVWTGRKVYTENWTGCYTLINPGDASDMSAIFDLETAINKNLDPKLHINIADDGTITMANGLKDPWSTQYHGRYITNASADAAAKWNTDASMAGSAGDNMDRGAILMYSNGANQKFGTKVKIEKGVVTATVSQIDANTPDNNKIGADDYVLAVMYTYTNGYGETAAITEGFSNNQQFLTGNGGMGGSGSSVEPTPTYTVNHGNGFTFDKTGYPRLQFVIADTNYLELEEVYLDNELLDSLYYEVLPGSTIVRIGEEFRWEYLTYGEHTIKFKFTNGEALASFIITDCEHTYYDEYGEKISCYCTSCGLTAHASAEGSHECWICDSMPEHCIDETGDHFCDLCNGAMCLKNGQHLLSQWGLCFYCNNDPCDLGQHIDEDEDIICDVCDDGLCHLYGHKDVNGTWRCNSCDMPMCYAGAGHKFVEGNDACLGCNSTRCDVGEHESDADGRCVNCGAIN